MQCPAARALVFSAVIATACFADEPPKGLPAAAAVSNQQELIKKLAAELTNVKLIGKITVTG